MPEEPSDWTLGYPFGTPLQEKLPELLEDLRLTFVRPPEGRTVRVGLVCWTAAVRTQLYGAAYW